MCRSPFILSYFTAFRDKEIITHDGYRYLLQSTSPSYTSYTLFSKVNITTAHYSLVNITFGQCVVVKWQYSFQSISLLPTILSSQYYSYSLSFQWTHHFYPLFCPGNISLATHYLDNMSSTSIGHCLSSKEACCSTRLASWDKSGSGIKWALWK
jgi:hypothetical protein